MSPRILFPVVLCIAFANTAMAASPDYMMEDCKNSAQIFFQEGGGRLAPLATTYCSVGRDATGCLPPNRIAKQLPSIRPASGLAPRRATYPPRRS